jgi:endonuclease III
MSNIPDDRLFQEDLRTEPFWMLVACVLVNVTRWAQARPVLDGIRARWPTAAGLAAADLSEVEQVVRCLGLGRRRAAKLVGLAAAWSRAEPRSRDDVLSLPGCGGYAADSWEMFVLGSQDVAPTDRALLSYLGGAPGGQSHA